ncbi:MAG TPA: 4Fe-4S dicluster domain-containing protein [Desulfobacteraceae bacterium]|nr:4Fe-4S dicluster domain-containing protein [Desulfobacteraceae bacterium]
MTCSRRTFLKNAVKGAIAGALPVAAFRLLSPAQARSAVEDASVRWGFLVDTAKCVGCGMCVKACKLENEIPYDAPVTRTWVERYVVTRDGRTHADSPMGARDGFTDRKIHGGEAIDPSEIVKAFFVPKLCNQCDKPSCVQVCPVGATYATGDGIVLVDRSWCIGCGHCIMACPYGVRFFHPVHKVAEKCNFCYHRITKGMKPACVEACPFGARHICNLKDHDDPVTRIILNERVAILKDEYGTKPNVFYLGLDHNVR